MAEGSSFLLKLPDEIIHNILSWITLPDLISALSTCRRVAALADHPLIWRQHCLQEYRYWHPDHSILTCTKAPVGDTDWKNLLAKRKQIDRAILRELNGIIGSQVGRVAKIQRIVDYRYDAKEVLTRHIGRLLNEEDVLARRYWATEALGCLERTEALTVWNRLSQGHDVPLDQALGVFDLFATEPAPESLGSISEHLDHIAASFLAQIPDAKQDFTWQKTFRLGTWLTANHFIGNRGEASYEEVQNTLISVSLCDNNHPSIPLLDVAIFCCIAQRVGINARPCGFPGHVLAIVYAPDGETLYGLDTGESNDPENRMMYLDPYNNLRQLRLNGLRTALTAQGIPSGSHAEFLGATPTAEIVIRMARNIMRWQEKGKPYVTVLEKLNPFAAWLHDVSEDSKALCTTVNRRRATYAASWALIFFSNGPSLDTEQRLLTIGPHLNALFRNFEETSLRCDLRLVQRYILSLFPEGNQREFLAERVQEILEEDNTPVTIQKRLHNAATSRVRYSIGQVFKHKRYDYHAAIIGWDTACRAGEPWIRQMRVDSLSGGRDQCFYQVIVDDETMRYVAEENIKIICPGWKKGHCGPRGNWIDSGWQIPDPPTGLWRMAGRWFKRWDEVKSKFVSNIKDQYPDD